MSDDPGPTAANPDPLPAPPPPPPPPVPPPPPGAVTVTAPRFCAACGNPVATNTRQCAFCGAVVAAAAFPGQKSRLVAGLLGIFVGGFGVHSFYLGDTKKGVWQIVATVLTCGIGSLWGFVEGVMILAGKINTDVDGVPLAD